MDTEKKTRNVFFFIPNAEIRMPPPPPPPPTSLLGEPKVYEEVTPELIERLSQNYKGLQYIFCGNFSGEILPKDYLSIIAGGEIDTDNICGFLFKMRKLSLAYSNGDETQKLDSESGELTTAMRDLIRNAKPGGSLTFEFTLMRDETTIDNIKTIIITE